MAEREDSQSLTLGDDGISLRSSERRPHTIIRYSQLKKEKNIVITNSKILISIMMISFLACKNESELWKVPIGYQSQEILLGDNYEELIGKIGKLKLDVNSDNSDDVKNYWKIPKEIEIENLQINSIIFLRFNRDELVRFETVYTIDEKVKPMNFQRIIEKLGEGELSEIDELVNMKRKSIVNNKELWLRRIDIDTISGEYPKIKYRVQAIP